MPDEAAGDDAADSGDGASGAEPRLSNEELIADIQRVADLDETGDPPIRDEYAEHGDHTPDTVADRFGSWSMALDAAGLDGDAARRRGGPNSSFGSDDVLDDIRRVAAREDTTNPPTTGEYREYGEYSMTPVYDRFGSWPEALVEAGLAEGSRKEVSRRGATRISDEALLDDLRRVAAREDTSDPPTKQEYDDRGAYNAGTLVDRFELWGGALDAAGLDGDAPTRRGAQWIPRKRLLEDIEQVAARDDTADPPLGGEYSKHGNHSLTTIKRRIGSWPEALDAAGLDGDAARARTGLTDKEEIAKDIRRVAELDETGAPPSALEYDEHGTVVSATTVWRRFGSWNEALEAAGFGADSQHTGAIPVDALLNDLRRVAAREDTADPPTLTEYETHGEFSVSAFYNKFDTWADATGEAGLGSPDDRTAPARPAE